MLNAILHDPRTAALLYFLAGAFWVYFTTLLSPDYKAMYLAWKRNAEKEREITRALKARIQTLEEKNASDEVQ